ncbi:MULTISPECIES: CHASE2 domain-containing protein [Cyanophyceae]|uniref:CHASE2 domain-containing protein n=1 Tax=Cyanophyceae TaxID=3028117 RepID=UPI001685A8B6|nr:CHASE2 domain-containing protein [Trichocoleus sp. FACHB-40]MBD2005268.1 CHASE2 domain-containing protein [Trichocoleus sp. FACHB-40]
MISRLNSKIRSLLSNTNVGTTALNFGGQVVLTSIVITGLVVGARALGMLQGQELGAFDQLIRLRPDEGPDKRVLLVEITEGDIQAEKGWPLSDETIARVLQKLDEYEPRAIGIDIIRDVPVKEGNADLLKVLKGSDRIITICQLSDGKQAGFPPPPSIPPEQVGFADFVKEPDGWVRRSLLVASPPAPKVPLENAHLCSDPEEQLTSLDMSLALIYLQAEGIEAEPTPDGNLKIASTVFKSPDKNAGGYRNADMEGLQMLINYRSANEPANKVTLTDVLKGKVDPALVKDKVVLVGYTATSVNDDFNTPYSASQEGTQKMPGVTIHAQVVSQILSAVLDKRPLFWYWNEWGELFWIWGWSLAGGILAWRIRRPWLLGIAGGVAIVVLYGTCYVLFLQAGWIPLIPPALALVATAGGVLIVERGYAKAIYKSVKGFLKIDIEIDEEKKERQVAEITETDYFQELQQKGKNLRSRGGTSSKAKATPASQAIETTEKNDGYLQQLQQQGKNLRPRHSDVEIESNPHSSEATVSPQVVIIDETNDYLQQLQQKAENRHRDVEIESNTQTSEVTVSASVPVITEETDDYLQQLQQKAKNRKNRRSDVEIESNTQISEAAVSASVPVITEEIDYFEQLQQKANLKNGDADGREAATEIEEDTQISQDAQTPEEDYFQQLQQRVQLKNLDANAQTEGVTEIEEDSQVSQDAQTAEEDYFQQLQQRVRLKNLDANGQTEGVAEVEEDSQVSQEVNSSEEDYFQQLQQRANKRQKTEDESK